MSDAPAPQSPAADSELEPEPGASKQETRWLAMVFGGIAAGYLGLILTFELGAKPPTPSWFTGPAFKPMNMDAALGVCGLLGFLGLLAWGVLRRHPRVHTPQLRRFASASLIALVVASVFISFYGRKVQQRNFTQMHDTFHYGLGPKYFEELGYFGLYDCTAQVLGKKHFRTRRNKPPSRDIRDLQTYGKLTFAESAERKCLETRFADPERRAEFEADIQTFIDLMGARRVKKALNDHGYNGAPFHAAFAGAIANAFDITPTSLPLLVSLDGLGLFVMLFVIARAYGWRAGLIFALFFLTHVVDRNKSIGAAFIRYSWMISLGIGIACLHRKKMGWGAFWLVAASMLNVFPLLFGLGVVAKGVADWVREKKLNEGFRKFLVVGALATGGLGLIGGAGTGRGVVGSYQEFFHNMAVHADGPPNAQGKKRERIPGFGVGLKFTFMYRGEHGLDKNAKRIVNGWVKSRQYREIKPLAQGLGLLMTGLALAIATRLAYAEAAILVGFVAFYSLLGTVAYYFTCASLVWLIWHSRRRRAGAYLMALGFWLISLTGYLVWLRTGGDSRVLFNIWMSFGWFFYIWAMLIYLAWDTGLLQRAADWIAAPAPPDDDTLAS